MRKLKITLLGGFILCIGLSLFLVSAKKENTKDLKLGINRPSVSKKETIDYVYKNLDEFLSNLSDLLTKTSEELTKTYFSHYNE